jgi:PAS domain S-box-containing protein
VTTDRVPTPSQPARPLPGPDDALMRSEDLVRALRGILTIAMIGSGFGLAFGLYYDDRPATVVSGVSVIAVPLLWWLVARGYATAATLSLLALFDLLTVYALLFGGGVQDPTAMLLPVMVIASGILLDRRLALGASAVIVASGIGFGIAELSGLAETRLSHLLSTSDVVFLSILLLVVAGLVYVMSRALRESIRRAQLTERSYQEVFNASGEGIIVHDADSGAILDINDSALAMFGYSRASRNDLDLDAFDHADGVEGRGRFRDQLAEAGHSPRSFEWRIRRRDGESVWVDVTLRAAVIQGHERVVSVLRDTSERRALQEQVHQSEKLRAVGQLARGVAHDFNNQLTVILANASLLQSSVGADRELSECAEAIIESSRRSADLTQQLLAFARRGQRKDELVDIDHLVADVTALLARSIDKRIEVVHVRADEPAIVRGDATFLQNALLNLGLNARDAMPEGGTLRFTVGRPAARAGDRTADATRSISIVVEDTGCGMSKSVQEHIFEPFYTTKEEGNGMGLAAVYGTVAAHEGAISVQSEPDRGTRFTVTLPAAAERSAPVRSPSDETASERFAGVRVLLVDDEAAVAAVARRMLTRLGCEVTVCEDGAAALDALKDETEDYDVVLLDQAMPRMSGAEVLQQIRAQGLRLPVVAISGYTEQTGSALRHRPDAFLPKPFGPTAIADVLDEVLERR